MAKSGLFNPKAFVDLQNAMSQFESLQLALGGLRDAAASAKEILTSVGNAEEARDKIAAELATITAEIAAATTERAALVTDLNDLRAKQQETLRQLQKMVAASDELK